MSSDFLTQEEIDILLGKKEEAAAPAPADIPIPAAAPAPAEATVEAGVFLPADASVPVDPALAGRAVPDVLPGQFSPGLQTERESPPNLEFILEFPLHVSICLGKVKKTLGEIRRFSSGTVMELDRLVHEPLDIFTGGKLVARGEVVIIEENYGIRITEIMDPLERVKKLR